MPAGPQRPLLTRLGTLSLGERSAHGVVVAIPDTGATIIARMTAHHAVDTAHAGIALPPLHETGTHQILCVRHAPCCLSSSTPSPHLLAPGIAPGGGAHNIAWFVIGFSVVLPSIMAEAVLLVTACAAMLMGVRSTNSVSWASAACPSLTPSRLRRACRNGMEVRAGMHHDAITPPCSPRTSSESAGRRGSRSPRGR